MGFWRAIYYYMDWVYIGSKEQAVIDRQKHLKYMNCQQIKAGGVKLRTVIKAPPNWKKNKRKRKK